jgi:glucokinase
MLRLWNEVKRRIRHRIIYHLGMLLAADIGGTKTLMGLFERDVDRPLPIVTREYATLDFESFEELVETFLDETRRGQIDAICAGIAGPVTGQVARLTSAAWIADADAIARRLGGCPAVLINDLEATAFCIPVLEPEEIHVLQEGVADPSGNAAVIAAGTGLGEALLHNLHGTFVPAASEGGHADFGPRTPRELALAAELIRTHGRVEVERVISGRGLVNIFLFTHGARDAARACEQVPRDAEGPELAAAVSASALERRCPRCVEALDLFVAAYGAEAGNVALRFMATAGVYIGGGIAPKILPAITRGGFMDAFLDKQPMVDLLRTFPVRIILNPAAALLGAAVHADTLDDAGER